MSKLEIIKTESGKEVLIAGKRHVHSKYNPEKEAERQVQSLDIKEDTLIFLIGPGLGYLLSPLLAIRDTFIVVFENPVFLKGLNLTESEESRVVVIESSKCDKTFSIGDWHPEKFSSIKVIKGPAYQFDNHYSLISSMLQEKIDNWSATAVTTTAFRHLWAENFLNHITINSQLLGWKDIRLEQPAVLIAAAGPSLADARDWLLKSEVPVWTVDTAWPVLKGWGIEPVLVVSNDPQPESVAHFAENAPMGATLLTSMTAAPGVARLFERRLYYNDNYPLNGFFPEISEYLPLFSQAGGSAVMLLYQLAVECGARHIVMLGQDLGAPPEQSHTTGTLYQRQDRSRLTRFGSLETMEFDRWRTLNSKVVEGVTGPTTVTPALESYCRWLEEFIRTNPQVEFLNTATRGVVIDGARQVRLSSLNPELDLVKKLRNNTKRLIAETTPVVAWDRAAGLGKMVEWLQSGDKYDVIDYPELPEQREVLDLISKVSLEKGEF